MFLWVLKRIFPSKDSQSGVNSENWGWTHGHGTLLGDLEQVWPKGTGQGRETEQGNKSCFCWCG